LAYNGIIFVLSGPAGVGKNTIMKQVLAKKHNLRQMPTATTRPIRPDEQEGREHYFVTLDQFRQMIADGALIEYQENYPGMFYGTPRRQLQHALEAGDQIIADIDVKGASELKKAFPENVVVIFVAPPSPEDLETRLRARGNMPEGEIAERLKRSAWELGFASQSDYQIVNDKLESSVEAVCKIICDRLHDN